MICRRLGAFGPAPCPLRRLRPAPGSPSRPVEGADSGAIGGGARAPLARGPRTPSVTRTCMPHSSLGLLSGPDPPDTTSHAGRRDARRPHRAGSSSLQLVENSCGCGSHSRAARSAVRGHQDSPSPGGSPAPRSGGDVGEQTEDGPSKRQAWRRSARSRAPVGRWASGRGARPSAPKARKGFDSVDEVAIF